MLCVQRTCTVIEEGDKKTALSHWVRAQGPWEYREEDVPGLRDLLGKTVLVLVLDSHLK